MPRPRRSLPLVAALIAAASFVSACRTTLVVVPSRDPGYTERDTLYGQSDGRNVRVTFRHDTTWRVDTVVRVDTAWRGGTRIIQRIDTLIRVDTVRVRQLGAPISVDTIRVIVRDTLRVPGVGGRTRVDTIVRVDTVRIPTTVPTPRPVPGGGRVRVDTIVRYDTIRVVQRDTIRVVQRDTIRVVQRDTVRIPGQRVLFVPPGQYPPQGQCRVWIPDRPPGQQPRAAACTALGNVPPGAFILFGGEAWDADYDWVQEAQRRSVPPEIIAVTRRGGRR